MVSYIILWAFLFTHSASETMRDIFFNAQTYGDNMQWASLYNQTYGDNMQWASFNTHIARDTMRLPIYNGKILRVEEKSAPAHRGIFIQPSTDFNVRSCSDGRVQNVFKVGSDWAMVIMQNDTSFAYVQMDSVVVNPGEFVNKGDLIGQRKLIPKDYKSIIFFVLKGNKELDPEKFVEYRN